MGARQSFGGTAGVALTAIARHHGLDLVPRDLALLLDTLADGELLDFLHAARLLGFHAVPLEGDYEELPEVPRPNVVVLHDAQRVQSFRVLTELSPTGVTVLDPQTAIAHCIDRASFVMQWTGDAVQLTPDPVAMDAVRKQLIEARDPRRKLRRALGLDTPARSVGFLVGVFAVVVLTAQAVAHAPLALLKLSDIFVGGALVVALWSALLFQRCANCSRTVALVGGLPVAWAGVFAYACVLVLARMLAAPTMVATALLAALGVHVGLLFKLYVEEVYCLPCVVVAVLCVLAGLCTIALGGVSPATVLVVVPGAVLTPLIADRAARRWAAVLDASSRRLAARVVAERTPLEHGHIELVVYTRRGCPQCSLFEVSLRPAIVDLYGDGIPIVVVDAADEHTITPLVIVRGARMSAAMLGLPDDGAFERVCALIDAAGRSDPSALEGVAGVWVSKQEG